MDFGIAFLRPGICSHFLDRISAGFSSLVCLDEVWITEILGRWIHHHKISSFSKGSSCTTEAWMMLCYGISQAPVMQSCGLKRWRLPHTLNTIGLGLQLGFGTIAAMALRPTMCFQHPNGRYSVLNYPSIFCWEEGHGAMLAMGMTSLAIIVAGFAAACTYATWKLPHWSVSGNHQMVQCFRFCSANFQLNSYGFQSVTGGTWKPLEL